MFLFNSTAADTAANGPANGERPIRSLAKAASWRVTGSIDTLLLSWLFTGDLGIAAAIGLTEVVTKMLLYYLHERAWNRIGLGRSVPASAIAPGVVATARTGLAVSPAAAGAGSPASC